MSFDLSEALKQNQILLSPKQIKQFQDYASILIEYNKKVNLTALTKESDIYLKHFYDSLLPAFIYPFKGSLCDVGAGAGFPSLPLLIVFPELKVTIVEPLKKRIKFLEFLSSQLNLKVTLVNERAEVYSKTNREKFDIVTARAVAELPMLIELCGALVKEKGIFLALKGQAASQEVKEAKNSANLIGLNLLDIYKQELNDEITRHNVIYEKVKKTPLKYPRHFSAIKKQPL